MRSNQPHTEALLDAENPWPGLHEFTESAKDYFNGRDEERAALFRLVRDARLVVLFGRSGLGKTSLLKAGLFPRLRRENYLPIFVRLDSRDRTAPLIDQARDAFIAQLTEQVVDHPPFTPEETLWEYLHRQDLELWSSKNYPLIPVFVFDQFEEVFTLGAQNAVAVNQLRTDMADLIENLIPGALAKQWYQDESEHLELDLQRQGYKVVISLREDFLPEIETWRPAIPSLMGNRLRLMPMDGAQAFMAVHQTGGKELVDKSVSQEIVQFVAAAGYDEKTARKVPTGENGSPRVRKRSFESASMEDLVIEPALLSLVCTKLNDQRKTLNKNLIDHELLETTGYDILNQFYESCMHDMPERTRWFVEDELITETGYRNAYPKKDAIQRDVISPEHLESLVRCRLLRVEARMAVDRIELVHDRLTRVIRESRDRRRQQQEEQARKDAEEQQQKELEALRKTAMRRLYLSIGIGIVCILCVILAILSIYQTQKARKAKDNAAKNRALLVEFENRSGGLIEFMLGDLKNKLEPLGRLDLFAAVVEKCRDYHELYPIGQMSDKSMLNHAKALRILGDIVKKRGDLGAAEAYYLDSLKIFKRLAGRESENDQWQAEIADSYSYLGDIELARGRISSARDYFEQFAEAFRILTEKDPTAIGWQKNLAGAYIRLGDIEMTQGNVDQAKNYYRKHLELGQRFTEMDPMNMDWQAELATSLTRLGEVEYTMGDKKEAKGLLQQAFKILNELAEKDPTNVRWQRDLAVSAINMGDISATQENVVNAKELFHNYYGSIKQLVEKDPTNVDWQRDLANSASKLGNIELMSGHPSKALEFYKEEFQINGRLAEKNPSNAILQRGLAGSLSRLGETEVKLGNLDKAMDYLQNSYKRIKRLAETDPNNATWQNDLATLFRLLGDTKRKQGNLDKAIDYFKNSCEIIKHLAETDPDNATWQRDLSISLSRAGQTEIDQGNLDKAKAYLLNSYEIMKRLAETDPDDTIRQRNLAALLNDLGFIEYKQGNLEKALSDFRQAYEIYAWLMGNSSSRAKWKEDFASLCDLLSFLYKEYGDNVQAKFYLGKGAKIRRQLESGKSKKSVIE